MSSGETAETRRPADGRTEPWLQWAEQSDVGRVRSENQDACGAFEDASGNRLLVVADGMGGHEGGATASRICVEVVGATFRSGEDGIPERLRRALERANAEVYTAACSGAAPEGMGTTVVALAVAKEGDAWVAWVGDSRAYRLRGGRLERLTEDHSVVADWVRRGLLGEEDARRHPRRNELLRSIGFGNQVQVDLGPVEARAGDRFLLCSDGLSGVVPEPEIEALLADGNPEAAVRRLVARANELGGPDNVTVQIARVLVGGSRVAAAARPPGAERRRVIRLAATAVALTLLLAALGLLAALRGGGGFPLRGNDPAAPERPREETTPEVTSPPPGDVTPPMPDVAAPSDTSLLEAPLPPLPEETPPTRVEAPLEFLAEVPARERKPERKERPARATESKPVARPETRRERSEVASAPLSAPTLAPAPAPPAEPAPPPPPAVAEPLEASIRGFLSDWSRAVETHDYELYQRLGMRSSREEFHWKYGRRKGVVLDLDLIDYARPSSDVVDLRVRMTFAYEDAGLARRYEKERKIRLRQTDSGLRYAGGWE